MALKKWDVKGEWYHDGRSNELGTQNGASTVLSTMIQHGVQKGYWSWSQWARLES